MTETGMSAASATQGSNSASAKGMAAVPENSPANAENATRGGTYAPADRNFGDREREDTHGTGDEATEPAADTDARTAAEPAARIAEDGQTGGAHAGEGESKTDGGEVDYEALMRRDLATLKATFPELAGLNDIADMRGALRYAALRDLGLTAEEAYMAASAPRVRRDNRAHLSTPVTKGASTAMVGMSASELHTARELFGGMTDADIYSLYKRVSR